VLIRAAGVEDLPALRALLEELHATPDPWDDARAAAVLEAILGDPRRRLLIAEVDGGEPAGTIDVVVVPNLTRDARPYAVIENVVVAARFRRRGIGRALMDAAVEHARAEGCYKLQLISAARRGEAHALYEAAGFSDAFQGYRRYL
jgi:ribosomal protein S18 acetylase RimI-like enzyme